MDPMTLISLIMGGGSLLGGLFGRNTSNPQSEFGDPNSSFYKTAQSQYFNNLRDTLNASTPGVQGLLALQMAQGADYGGSSYIAGKQRENITKQNTEAAIQGSNQFMSNLFGQGLGLYGQGKMAQYQDTNSFANNLLGLGGGLLARYLGRQVPNNNSFPGGESFAGGLDSYNSLMNNPYGLMG